MEGGEMTLNILGLKIKLKREVIIILASMLILIFTIIGYLIVKGNSGVIIEAGGNSPSGSSAVQTSNGQASGNSKALDKPGDSALNSSPSSGESADKASGSQEIKIYVTGAVNKPGIVILKKGQIIDDAIHLAGGVTKEADLGNINLVYELKENLMLYIVSQNEISQAEISRAGIPPADTSNKSNILSSKSSAQITSSSAQITSGSEEAGKGIRIVRSSGDAVVNSNAESDNKTSKININTANGAELDTLPGVGAATAKDIIDYRDKSGPFKKIEDIMKVPRIKESRFARIKDFIIVD
jgi:competence protein ComEA